jgi:hypothetical protein
MSDIITDANETYRDFVVDGVPSSGPNDPAKSDIRALFTEIGGAIGDLETAIVLGGANRIYPNVAAALADHALPLGAFFAIPSTNPDGAFDYYEKSATSPATATYITTLASTAALDGIVAQATAAASLAAADSAAAAAASAAEAQSIAAMLAGTSGGYLFHPRTKKRFQFTSLDGVAVLAAAPQIFLDPENGNDSWDGNYGYRQGTSTSGPKKTRAGVEAHAAFVANASGAGVTIGIIAATVPWRDGFDYYEANSRNGNLARSYVNLCVYGGSTREIRCTDIIVKANITAHPTITNAYRIAVTHDMHSSGTSQFRMWVDDQPSLLRKQNESDCSAAGTYWYSAAPVAGGTTTITFHPYADSNPITDGHVYEVTMRDFAFGGHDGCSVEGIIATRNGNNNGSISLYNFGEVRRCLCVEGTKHNWLMGPGGEAFDVISINSQDSRNYFSDASGNQFVMFSALVSGLSGTITRCAGLIDASVYTYSGADAGGPISSWFYAHCSAGFIDTATVNDCWQSGIAANSSGEQGTTNLNNFTFFGSSQLAGQTSAWEAFGASTLIIRGLLALSHFTRMIDCGAGGTIDIENSIVVTDNSGGTSYLYSGGVGARLRAKNNLFVNNAHAAINMITWPLSAGAVIDITNNIFSGMYLGHDFTVNTDPAHAVIDRNWYDFALNGGSGSSLGTWKGTAYGSLSAWQVGTGFDANSGRGAEDGSTWLSGVLPDVNTVDVRLNTRSPAFPMMTMGIDQDAVNARLALPRTFAAASEYIRAVAPATPVLVSAA